MSEDLHSSNNPQTKPDELKLSGRIFVEREIFMRQIEAVWKDAFDTRNGAVSMLKEDRWQEFKRERLSAVLGESKS